MLVRLRPAQNRMPTMRHEAVFDVEQPLGQIHTPGTVMALLYVTFTGCLALTRFFIGKAEFAKLVITIKLNQITLKREHVFSHAAILPLLVLVADKPISGENTHVRFHHQH